jgi:hypothetical protein
LRFFMVLSQVFNLTSLILGFCTINSIANQ